MTDTQARNAANRKTEETYDFPDNSDCCDFGYVLEPSSAAKTRPAPQSAD